jgi:site-specific recombinase XerD
VAVDKLTKNAVDRMDNKIIFTPHIARYCMTTWLIDAGMPIRYIKWLRGDAIREAYEIYDTVRPEESH